MNTLIDLSAYPTYSFPWLHNIAVATALQGMDPYALTSSSNSSPDNSYSSITFLKNFYAN